MASMSISADILPTTGAPAKAASEPPLWLLVLIFWAAFAVAVISTGSFNPTLFERQDPDSFLRLVQVRDLLAGQGWFDLVQHRMDPPGGALLQWSRLIDAPIAGLILLGNFFGDGERFALTVWPVLLLFPLMGGLAAIGGRLGGRPGAVWTLVLALFFLNPIFIYLPNDIDHHNAQVALMVCVVALTLRIPDGARFGFFTACISALTLAIGLEMLLHVALVGAFIALHWAWSGRNGRPVAAYGATLAATPVYLYLATASPAAAWACDSLSWAYVIPCGVAGVGLAVVAGYTSEQARAIRLLGLALVGAASAAVFVIVTPECLAGPYGMLSPELRDVWLSAVTEAQPFQVYAAREPVGALGSLAPLAVAIVLAVSGVIRSEGELRNAWLLPALLIVFGTALCFYQIRTLPFTNAIAIPILGVWLAGLRKNAVARSTNPVRRAWPVAVGFLVAVPVTYVLVGMRALEVAEYLSDGRIAPKEMARAPEDLVKGLSVAEQNCFDQTSARLFSTIPRGLVMAPLFYGPSVLMLSSHDVVAGPYHRNGSAILDNIHAMNGTFGAAKAVVDERQVDYIAICALSRESAIAKKRAPEGFVSRVLAGEVPPWLQRVPGIKKTALTLWRIAR
jgi:hypothetical protein